MLRVKERSTPLGYSENDVAESIHGNRTDYASKQRPAPFSPYGPRRLVTGRISTVIILEAGEGRETSGACGLGAVAPPIFIARDV